MSYGWKHLNFNTAEPYLIGQIINDYLAVGDHETLKSIGLTQSAINELENGKEFFNPFGGLEVTAGAGPVPYNDFITSGEINPPQDLNIPGDLWKWQFWDPSTVPDEKYRGGGGSGRRTWWEERRRNAFNQNINEGVANGSIKIVDGETFKPYTISNTYVHPSLLKFETAPTVNRLLTLFNAYGGDRSFILTSLMGFPVYGARWLGILSGRTNFGEFPELADYPINVGIPFGQYSFSHNFYIDWMMRNAYPGIYSGFNYNHMRGIWAEGREPYNQQMIDPVTGTWYTQDEVTHGWGLPECIQVPTYYRGFSSPNLTDKRSLHNAVRISWDLFSYGVDICALGNPYAGIESFRYGAAYVQGNEPSTIKIQLPSGQIVEDLGYPEAVPFLEWPDIWDGNVYRPAKGPLTNLAVFGEREPFIEFVKEVSEHVTAINEWFNDGCPCDWPDYGGYVDPTVEAENAAAEAADVRAASQYVPTTTTSPTPPLNPKFGDLWRDSTTGKTKTFVQTSPTTGTWVDA